MQRESRVLARLGRADRRLTGPVLTSPGGGLARILDRIVHNAYRLALEGPSMRKPEAAEAEAAVSTGLLSGYKLDRGG